MSEKLPGSETYIPTRLEWLSVVLNGMGHIFNIRGLDSFFTEGDDEKTLLLVVIYRDNLPKEILDSYVNRARNLAQVICKRYGWDSWVEVKTEMTKIGSESSEREEENS